MNPVGRVDITYHTYNLGQVSSVLYSLFYYSKGVGDHPIIRLYHLTLCTSNGLNRHQACTWIRPHLAVALDLSKGSV